MFANGRVKLLVARRDGRVVDCTCLENRRTAMYPGFESLSLRFESLQPGEGCEFFFFVGGICYSSGDM